MTTALNPLIPSHVPAINRVSGIRPTMMELMNTLTGDIWLSVEPVTAADVAALTVDAPMVKYGPGVASMDTAWFDRSPGAAEDGALVDAVFGGRRFRLVAKAGRPKPLPGSMGIEMAVEKYHNAVFAAHAEVEFLVSSEGQHFVEQVDALPGMPPLALPPGYSLRRVTLAQPWVVRLPRPVRVFFFMPQFRSFHGPVADVPPDAMAPALVCTEARSAPNHASASTLTAPGES
jgi:hypothetical protein